MTKKILCSILLILSAANIAKAQTVADGTTEYTGEIIVHVDKDYSCPNVTYTITKNSDGTIDLILPEFTLEKTTIGTITVGSYTVKNISYNDTEKKYFRDYTSDGLSMHLKVSGVLMNLDGDYPLEKTGNIFSLHTLYKLRVFFYIVSNQEKCLSSSPPHLKATLHHTYRAYPLPATSQARHIPSQA